MTKRQTLTLSLTLITYIFRRFFKLYQANIVFWVGGLWVRDGLLKLTPLKQEAHSCWQTLVIPDLVAIWVLLNSTSALLFGAMWKCSFSKLWFPYQAQLINLREDEGSDCYKHTRRMTIFFDLVPNASPSYTNIRLEWVQVFSVMTSALAECHISPETESWEE